MALAGHLYAAASHARSRKAATRAMPPSASSASGGMAWPSLCHSTSASGSKQRATSSPISGGFMRSAALSVWSVGMRRGGAGVSRRRCSSGSYGLGTAAALMTAQRSAGCARATRCEQSSERG